MSSGNGTTRGYYVEVRTIAGVAVQQCCGLAVAREWLRVPIGSAAGGIGVPRGMYCREAEAVTELCSYTAANALMAWAAALGALDSVGLEFRLVEARFTYSWKVEEIAHGEPVSFFERQRQEFPNKPRVGSQESQP